MVGKLGGGAGRRSNETCRFVKSMRDRLASRGMILAVVALGLQILAGSLALTMGSVGLGASVFLVPIAAGLSFLGLVYSVLGYGSSKRAAVLGIALCVTAGMPAVLISIMLIRGLLAGVSVPAIGVSLS